MLFPNQFVDARLSAALFRGPHRSSVSLLDSRHDIRFLNVRCFGIKVNEVDLYLVKRSRAFVSSGLPQVVKIVEYSLGSVLINVLELFNIRITQIFIRDLILTLIAGVSVDGEVLIVDFQGIGV